MPVALRVTPWPDPVLDVLGHDPRSWYAETFWLPTLGPTALLLMRHLADRFERTPEGVELPVADTAAALGLGAREGNSSPLMRSLSRLRQFELAHTENETTISVRRALPPVHRRHVRRLPLHLQAKHDEWMAEQRAAPIELARRRARRVALDARRAGRADGHRRTRAAHRGIPSRARARSRALGARPPARARSTTPTSPSWPPSPDPAASSSAASAQTRHCRLQSPAGGWRCRGGVSQSARPTPPHVSSSRRGGRRPELETDRGLAARRRERRRAHRRGHLDRVGHPRLPRARTACGRRIPRPRRPRRSSTTWAIPRSAGGPGRTGSTASTGPPSRTPRTTRSSSSSARARCTSS